MAVSSRDDATAQNCLIQADRVAGRDVNETLKPETKTRPRLLAFSPRWDRDQDYPRFPRDRDLSKVRLETVSRPRLRDQDYIPGGRVSYALYRVSSLYSFIYFWLILSCTVYRLTFWRTWHGTWMWLKHCAYIRRLTYFGSSDTAPAWTPADILTHILLHGHTVDNVKEDCAALHITLPEADGLAKERCCWRTLINSSKLWSRSCLNALTIIIVANGIKSSQVKL